MLEIHKLGVLGEKKAVEYIESIGYKILHQNININRAEIDIIALYENTIRFIEVKTLKSMNDEPQMAVNLKKQKILFEAAQIYKDKNLIEMEILFDVISVKIVNKKTEIILFKDAFYDPEF